MIVPIRSDDEKYMAIGPSSDESPSVSPETGSQDGDYTARTEATSLNGEDTTQPTPTEGTSPEPTEEERSQSTTNIFSEDPELGLPDTDAEPKQHPPLPLVFHIVVNTAVFLGALVLLHISALLPHYMVYQLLGPLPNTDDSLQLRFDIYIISSWSSCLGFAGMSCHYFDEGFVHQRSVEEERGESDGHGELSRPESESRGTARTFQAAMGQSLMLVEMAWAGTAVVVTTLSLFVFSGNTAWKVLGGMVAPT